MKFATVLSALATAGSAHYTFPRVQGDASDWSTVRQTQNWQHNGPVTDVSSSAMTCYQNGGAAPSTHTVAAGSSITFASAPNVFHPGPLLAYMAKAPGSAKDFSGAGNVWFKVYQDSPSVSGGQYSWPAEGM
jgi:hypothetical protein